MFENKRSLLIEILIMVGIIGIVGLFSALAVNTARSKQRDAVRLSTISRVQSALENYFNETNHYPAVSGLPLGDTAFASCLGTEGFSQACGNDKHRFLRAIPSTVPSGLRGLVQCGTPARSAFCYSSNATASSYGIQFELENALPEAGLARGINCATAEKIQAGACQL